MLPETSVQECWENLNPCYKQDNVCTFIKLLLFIKGQRNLKTGVDKVE